MRELEIKRTKIGKNTDILVFYSVDEHTTYDENGKPTDGYGVYIRVTHMSPYGMATIEDVAVNAL